MGMIKEKVHPDMQTVITISKPWLCTKDFRCMSCNSNERFSILKHIHESMIHANSSTSALFHIYVLEANL